MTSKQRAYLKGLAMTMDPILQIGKSSLTPELTQSVNEALDARELIKIHVLKNCVDDGKILAQTLAERTRSQVVQVIGRTITANPTTIAAAGGTSTLTYSAVRDVLTNGTVTNTEKATPKIGRAHV